MLIVEDEEAMREVTQRILERHGYRVLTADGGASALALAAAYVGTIDLLLTDVVMPQMLGKEVADRVRAVHPESRLLYMSGYARPVLAEQGTVDEGVSLVSKPFSEATLLDAVRDVLEAGPQDSNERAPGYQEAAYEDPAYLDPAFQELDPTYQEDVAP